MKTQSNMLKRMGHNFQAIRGILKYLEHKDDTGLLQVTTIELVGGGVPLIVYEIHWGAYRAVVQPEFERLCDDHNFTPETWYAAWGRAAWSKIAHKDFTPDEFIEIQVLLHERREN